MEKAEQEYYDNYLRTCQGTLAQCLIEYLGKKFSHKLPTNKELTNLHLYKWEQKTQFNFHEEFFFQVIS